MRGLDGQHFFSAGAGRARPPTRAAFWVGVSLMASGAAWALPALAQVCPAEYAACDNGGCCLSSEQCCPNIEEGCCGSSTPFCCPGGGCAATPSQCNTSALVVCDGYDVPCGDGCAPAGSDCCDLAGHYCPPESMCTSETTCVRGDRPELALEVVPVPAAGIESRPPLAAPFVDPPDASERSCSVRPGVPARRSGGERMLLLLGALVAVRRWRCRAELPPGGRAALESVGRV